MKQRVLFNCSEWLTTTVERHDGLNWPASITRSGYRSVAQQLKELQLDLVVEKVILPVHPVVAKRRARVLWDPCFQQLERCSAAFGTSGGSKQSATGAKLKIIYYSPADWLKESSSSFLSFLQMLIVTVAQRSRANERDWVRRWYNSLFNARWNHFALFIQY